MKVKEMQEDLLRRYYENTINLLNSGALDDYDENKVLHEAVNTFAFACGKIDNESPVIKLDAQKLFETYCSISPKATYDSSQEAQEQS